MEYKAQDQYQRVFRAYEAIRKLATDIGNTAVIGDPTAVDATRSFFIECYHFKDWLKKDSQIKRPKDVEDFVSQNHSLSLAADLCNSIKHAGLDKSPRSGKQLDQINMAYSIDVPLSPEPGFIKAIANPSDGDTVTISNSNRKERAVATAKVVLTIGGQEHDAIGLATDCVNAWDTFLSTNGISFSKS